MALKQPATTLETVGMQTLIEDYNENPDTKYTSCLKTQSLRSVMDELPDNATVIAVTGTRKPDTTESTSLSINAGVTDYITPQIRFKYDWTLDYDRSKHLPFDWETVEAELDDHPDVWDFPINTLIVALEDDGIERFWTQYITRALERLDGGEDPPTDWIKPPFYAVLQTTQPGTDHMDATVERFNDDYYFLAPSNTSGEHKGMGWRPRTLDVTAIWSDRAFQKKGDVIFRRDRGMDDPEDLTPRKLEDALINHQEMGDPRYGAINAERFVNIVRDAFPNNTTDRKPFQLNDREEWEQVG